MKSAVSCSLKLTPGTMMALWRRQHKSAPGRLPAACRDSDACSFISVGIDGFPNRRAHFAPEGHRRRGDLELLPRALDDAELDLTDLCPNTQKLNKKKQKKQHILIFCCILITCPCRAFLCNNLGFREFDWLEVHTIELYYYL